MEVLGHAIVAQDTTRLEVGWSATSGWSLRARLAIALVLIVGVDRRNAPQCLVTVMTVPSKDVEGGARTWGVGMSDVLQKVPTIAEAAWVANDTGAHCSRRLLGSDAIHGIHKLSGKALDAVLVKSSDVLARWNVIAGCVTAFMRKFESSETDLSASVVGCGFHNDMVWIHAPRAAADVRESLIDNLVKVRQLTSASHENDMPLKGVFVD